MSACTASHYWQLFSSTYQVVTLQSFHNLFSCQPESLGPPSIRPNFQSPPVCSTCCFDHWTFVVFVLHFFRTPSSACYPTAGIKINLNTQSLLKKNVTQRNFYSTWKIWSSSMRTWFSHIKRNSHIILTPNKLPMPHTSCLNHFEAFNPMEKSHFVEILNNVFVPSFPNVLWNMSTLTNYFRKISEYIIIYASFILFPTGRVSKFEKF